MLRVFAAQTDVAKLLVRQVADVAAVAIFSVRLNQSSHNTPDQIVRAEVEKPQVGESSDHGVSPFVELM